MFFTFIILILWDFSHLKILQYQSKWEQHTRSKFTFNLSIINKILSIWHLTIIIVCCIFCVVLGSWCCIRCHPGFDRAGFQDLLGLKHPARKRLDHRPRAGPIWSYLASSYQMEVERSPVPLERSFANIYRMAILESYPHIWFVCLDGLRSGNASIV